MCPINVRANYSVTSIVTQEVDVTARPLSVWKSQMPVVIDSDISDV